MPYIEKLSALCREYGCEIKTCEPLKNHTTFRIGGNCRAMVSVNSAESLRSVTAFLKDGGIRYFVLGRGSNIIASDEGFDGVIVKIARDFSEIRLVNETEIFCTAGASLKDVCLFSLEKSLAGMEFAYGIPGTCGGALYMNAGAYGGEIKDIIKTARYTDGSRICEITPEEMLLSYRHSVFAEKKELVITDMVFSLKKGDPVAIKAKMDELMESRRTKQPLEYPSAVSTFKRPEGSYASLLIEQCGLKGFSVGDAEVSVKHSGFVVNKGGATCRDVLKLTDEVRRIVKEKTGFELELEPVILR